MPAAFSKPKSVKIPPIIPISPPPSPTGIEAAKAKEDVKLRQAKAKGRRASRLTTPGTLAISDVNILRPGLKDTLG